MNRKNIILSIILLFAILQIAEIVSANMVQLGRDKPPSYYLERMSVNVCFSYIAQFLFVLFLVVIIEFAVVYLIIRKMYSNRWKLFRIVFTVNLYSFGLMFVVGLFISGYWYYSTELIPFILEFFLYRMAFNSLKENNEIDEKIPNKTIVIITILANLVSLLLGFVIYFPFST